MKKYLLALLPLLAFAAAKAPNDSKAEKEINANMTAYKEAMIHNDAAVLGKLLGDDLTYVHSAGQLESKADVLENVTSGKNVITKMEFTDMSVRIYDNTALARCRVDLWHSDTNIVHMNVLHTWIKRPQGWQLVARQATKLAK